MSKKILSQKLMPAFPLNYKLLHSFEEEIKTQLEEDAEKMTKYQGIRHIPINAYRTSHFITSRSGKPISKIINLKF